MSRSGGRGPELGARYQWAVRLRLRLLGHMDTTTMLGGESEEKGAEYREPSILLPPPGKSYGEMLGMSWQLLCVLVILGIHGEVDTQLFAPFFLSRVVSVRRLPVCLSPPA